MEYDLNRMRQQVSVPSVLAFYGIYDEDLLCLWHKEDGASLHVYEDHLYCYGCKKRKDIFDLVMAKEKCSLEQAVRWIADKAKILPTQAPKIVTSDYKGPVPREWIDYWHSQLEPAQRELLHKRLLSDATIDRHKIGWRSDYQAFVFPYWRGVPGISDVDIIQYRATSKTPPYKGKVRRYWSQQGYNHPAYSNRHMWNSELAIFVIGTVDALLGEQDCLPIFSLNGTDTLLDPKRDETIEIREQFAGVKHKYIIPDATLVEFLPAQRLAENLGAQVRFFPYDREWQGKDYNDMRLAGLTPAYLFKEVLQMPEGQYVWMIKPEHVEFINDVVEMVTRGDGQTAFKILQSMFRDQQNSGDNYYQFGQVCHTFQLMTHRRPDKYADVFTPDEWYEMGHEFSQTINFQELAGVIQRWSELAGARLGGF